jgi:16S rRNA (cytosine1402-N4)-methyltransferase
MSLAMVESSLVEFEADEHIPVLREAVVGLFDFARPAVLVDGTVGLGGHAEALLDRYSSLTILGSDWDAQALRRAEERLARFGRRFLPMEVNFADLPEVLPQRGYPKVDGILLDLGLSSFQLQDPARGFSFHRAGPLDMRMSPKLSRTAWDLLQDSSEEELAYVFKTYGEEPRARSVAHALKGALAAGALTNSAWRIAECIRLAIPGPRSHRDPATRCFQALRIAVNRELEQLDWFLATCRPLFDSGGRLAILAYHSLEDRRVKRAFQQAVKGCVCPPQSPQCICGRTPWARLTFRKALQASDEEIRLNPRARSVRLRALEIL